MRKNYFYALMAVALALTACSKDVPERINCLREIRLRFWLM